MFYITPTPTSWIIWTIIWVIGVLLGLGLFILGSVLRENRKNNVAYGVFALVALVALTLVGLTGSSYYHNYTNSSSYNMAKKNLKIEYDMNQRRTIIIKDYKGDIFYEYTGSFSYKMSSRKVDLTDNKTGNKISVYMGDNDTFIVTDAGIKGEKK
ncbi:hypothetical protein [Lactococcus lactis]|uniref:hypothetical protein n=1 Tax=Lactococcus lactis TaxID=1358 RepID=UPI00384E74BB